LSTDATSNTATIGSDDAPSGWPDVSNADDTAITEPEPANTNGVNGTKSHEEISTSASWTAPLEDYQATTINDAPVQQSLSSAPPSRPSRIVDPSKFSWASIVKPAAPPPALPKPPVISKTTPIPSSLPEAIPTPPQPSSRPSTRGKDVSEEPAQTIHDAFTSTEPSKPKVQLPQPVLPYIPPAVSAPKGKVPVAPEPLISRNLDILEEQQHSLPQTPTASVSTHRTSPAPKSDAPPPGLSPRFPRTSRDNPVIMPGMVSRSIAGIQLQFGYIHILWLY